MASAIGNWVLKGALKADCFVTDNGLKGCPSSRSPELKLQRNYHYTFDVDDNGLDINGFILQTDKHKGKKQKFRVYLDSNENGLFDKRDPLIGMSALKKKHAAKGVGNLLDEDEIGQLEVTFKKPKSNASMRSLETFDTGRGPLNQIGNIIGISPTFLFLNPEGDPTAYFNETNLGVHTVGAKAAWGQLH